MKLTEEESELLDTICSERGCMNANQDGYVYCRSCMHGSDHLASEDAQELKKRIEAEKKT